MSLLNGFVAGVGLLVCVSWALDIDAILTLYGAASMKFITAAGFVCIGVGGLLRQREILSVSAYMATFFLPLIALIGHMSAIDLAYAPEDVVLDTASLVAPGCRRSARSLP